MRPVTEWTIDDLRRLHADEIPESLTLDYKESGTLKKSDGGKKELAKDVSSFANSAGGRIVIGMREQDNKPAGLDDGVDDNEWSRESIEQTIDSNVIPRILGLYIHPIPISGGKTYYVIDIPQAISNAPHQVKRDKKYHKRLNFTTIEMEDYEIRDAMRRSDAPDLYIDSTITKQNKSVVGSTLLTVRLNIRNESSQFAEHALIRWYYDQRCAADVVAGLNFSLESAADAEIDGNKISLAGFRSIIHPTNHMPIYKEEQPRVALIDIEIPAEMQKAHFVAAVSCPGCSRFSLGAFVRSGDTFAIEQKGTVPVTVL